MKIDLEKLLNSEDKNSSIIELDEYISQLCENGNKIERLNKYQKTFFLNQELERYINSGGFESYYSSSSGNFAKETVKTLKEIGANKTAKILENANKQFPNNIVPADLEDRESIVEDIIDEVEEIWEELEDKFSEYEDDLNSLNINYIKKNKGDF